MNVYDRRVCSGRICVSSGLLVSLRRRHQERSDAPETAGIRARPRGGLLAIGCPECERVGHVCLELEQEYAQYVTRNRAAITSQDVQKMNALEDAVRGAARSCKLWKENLVAHRRTHDIHVPQLAGEHIFTSLQSAIEGVFITVIRLCARKKTKPKMAISLGTGQIRSSV